MYRLIIQLLILKNIFNYPLFAPLTVEGLTTALCLRIIGLPRIKPTMKKPGFTLE